MATGTTTTKANMLVGISKSGVSPANGVKKIVTSIPGATGGVPSNLTEPLKGPDKGNG